jgi:putative ABC transport system ATP-binding protein
VSPPRRRLAFGSGPRRLAFGSGPRRLAFGSGPRSPALGTRPSRAENRQPRAARNHGPVIQVTDVFKTYALGGIAVRALRGVSLEIERGEYIAIMGPSGSGKSTLMHILGCLDVPTSGSYRINGDDIAGLDEDDLSDLRNRYIGFVFQAFNLVPRTRALANVALPLQYAGLSKAERLQRAKTALAMVGLSDRADHLPSELSGGQQQRAAVARALVTNPALILADEPTGNLDTHSTREVLEIFDHLNRQGRTIVLITHEEEVARHARRIIRVRDGRIVSDSPAAQPGEVAV